MHIYLYINILIVYVDRQNLSNLVNYRLYSVNMAVYIIHLD